MSNINILSGVPFTLTGQAWYVIMKSNKNQIVSPIFIFLMGLFFLFYSIKLSIWNPSGPDAGFFPLITASTIIFFSLLLILKNILKIIKESKQNRTAQNSIVNGTLINNRAESKVLQYSISTLAYAILFGLLGFIIASTIFLLFLLKYIEKQSWRMTVLTGIIAVIVSYILFRHLLGVPLPLGLINFHF